MSENIDNNSLVKKKRTDAMIKAQKKYYEKIKLEQPETYKARNKKYAKIQYQRNKKKDNFMETNRQNVKKYYENNKEMVSMKRKEYYKENRDTILSRQKIARDKKKNIHIDNDNKSTEI